MTDKEIYFKYHNIVGDDPHKIRVLKNLTAKSTKELRDIIKQQDNLLKDPKAEPKKTVQTWENLPAAVFNAITDKLESLETSIKLIESQIFAEQQKKKILEDEYKELSEFIKQGGYKA